MQNQKKNPESAGQTEAATSPEPHAPAETRAQSRNKKHQRWLKMLAGTLCVLAIVAVAVTLRLYLQYRSRIQALSTLRDAVYMDAAADGNFSGTTAQSSASGSGQANSQDAATAAEAVTGGQEDATQVAENDYGTANTEAATADDATLPICSQIINFSTAHATNSDIYAWITVPGTDVDLPILQSDTTDDYYLLRNLDGSSGYPGCLYTNASCNNRLFTDSITVVYGHNMPQGGMFTSLHNFEDQAVFDENQTFTVYTEQNRFTYELVAAVWYNDDYIPYYYDTTTGQGVLEFWHSVTEETDTVNEPSRIREGTEITAEDQLCVLSTCCRKNGSIVQGRRYLVIGRLLETAACE